MYDLAQIRAMEDTKMLVLAERECKNINIIFRYVFLGYHVIKTSMTRNLSGKTE